MDILLSYMDIFMFLDHSHGVLATVAATIATAATTGKRAMVATDEAGWCILRTSPSKTLKLAETLGKDGYSVWTPVETKVIRIHHANVRRETRLPIMPSYIFAKASHLVDLLELAAMPVKPRRGAGWGEPAHANFSVMRFSGTIPTVSDRQLTALRVLEAKRTPRKRADQSFAAGVGVRVQDRSFGGLVGKVQHSDTKRTIVSFGSKFKVTIATSLLELDDIRGA